MISIPVIIVVAYNRPGSLKRLLDSLSRAVYSLDNVSIIISIDHKENDSRSLEVVAIANSFEWKFGHKTVLLRESNLGLRKHILECGDMLLNKFESAIVLEDDLFVSPYFYEYALQSLPVFSDDTNICGISLYSPKINEYTGGGFIPLDDGFNNYFIQSASSWGQLWTRSQWRLFKDWYDNNAINGVTNKDNLPLDVSGWPESSWKKYFIKYQVETNRYFSYPRVSLSTNFSEIGAHLTVKSNFYQTSLLAGGKTWSLLTLEQSLAVYDCFYELSSLSVENLFQSNTEFDLYGTKKLSQINSKYLVSVKKCTNPIEQYANDLIPSMLNIFYSIKGEGLSYGKTSDFKDISDISPFKDFSHLGLTFVIRLVLFKFRVYLVNKLASIFRR